MQLSGLIAYLNEGINWYVMSHFKGVAVMYSINVTINQNFSSHTGQLFLPSTSPP
jgi:hypothetical protein